MNFYGKCRNVEDFTKIGRIGDGSYGTVYRAKDVKTGEIVALKRVKMENEDNGMPVTCMREISILKRISHPNIVLLKEIAVGSKLSSVFLVFEYCEHDLALLIDSMKKSFNESETKRLMLHLLSAVEHLHSHHLIHRDIKLSNILYNSKGQLKLADFGLSRQFGSDCGEMTPGVVTLWYRSVEVLLGALNYDQSIDLWAIGCVFGELLLKKPLFPGKSEIHQLNLIFELLGYPNDKIWPDYKNLPIKIKVPNESFSNLHHRFKNVCSEKGIDLLERLLTFDPKKRITAKEALNHPYFQERPLPKEEFLMPTFKSTFDL